MDCERALVCADAGFPHRVSAPFPLILAAGYRVRPTLADFGRPGTTGTWRTLLSAQNWSSCEPDWKIPSGGLFCIYLSGFSFFGAFLPNQPILYGVVAICEILLLTWPSIALHVVAVLNPSIDTRFT
jgi:hypothetical protein